MQLTRTGWRLALTALWMLPIAASANQYLATFTSTDFVANAGSPVPQGSVSGSFIFSSHDLNAPMQSVDAVSLVIAGHTYSTSEVIGSTYYYSDGTTAGHRFDGAFAGQAFYLGTNDFTFFIWDLGGLGPTVATYGDYTTSAVSDFFYSNTGTSSIAAVPEPSAGAMLMAGMVALAALTRRRRRAKHG